MASVTLSQRDRQLASSDMTTDSSPGLALPYYSVRGHPQDVNLSLTTHNLDIIIDLILSVRHHKIKGDNIQQLN